MKKQKLLVFGGTGMLGSAITRRFQQDENWDVKPIGSNTFNLVTPHENYTPADAIRLYKPDLIIHCAGLVGGIAANKNNQFDFLYQNNMMALNVIKAAVDADIERLIYVGSSCMYPTHAPQPMKESYLLTGAFEPTNEGYALAKCAGMLLCKYSPMPYYQTLIPCNLYGPGDNFGPDGHMIAAIIKKVVDAKRNNSAIIELLGSGQAFREIMHVDDAADAIHFVANKIDECQDVVNIGTGIEYSVMALTKLVTWVLDVPGITIKTQLNTYTPQYDGMKRKVMNNSYLQSYGWRAKIAIEEGIRLLAKEYEGSLNKS